jgi:hypothetical protein
MEKLCICVNIDSKRFGREAGTENSRPLIIAAEKRGLAGAKCVISN